MPNKNDSSQVHGCFNQTPDDKRNKETLTSRPVAGQEAGAEGAVRKEPVSSVPPPDHREPQSAPEPKEPRTVPDSREPNNTPIGQLKKKPQCHMQLDHLVPSKEHTVLIDTNTFHSGKVVPFKGQHVWDSGHVKLPLVSVKSGMEARWGEAQRALKGLSTGLVTVGAVEEAIKSYNQKQREWRFDALQSYVKEVQKKENNFSTVIAKMARLALELPEHIRQPIPLLRQTQSRSITMSQVQIACLLANAFFCTFPHRNSSTPGSEYGSFPTINFSSLFGDACKRKTQKLKALFHYFNTVTDKDTKPDGLVTFERICIPPSQLPEWKRQVTFLWLVRHMKPIKFLLNKFDFRRNDTLTKLHISPNGSIEEDGKGMLQVDFACKFIGGGVLGRGLVQEEIRFLMNPELIVARLFTEKLADNECLKITGTQRYSTSSGYSDTFEWLHSYKDDTKSDEWKRRFCQIVAIDALSFKDPREQYTKESIKRELNKAYVGFKGDHNTPPEYIPAIATGNWGCGAFNGDPKLKALIQIMAAAVANRDLAYFTFGNERLAQDVQRMHSFLRKYSITVGHLYMMLSDYCEHYHRHKHRPKGLYEYITQAAGQPSSQL